MDENRIKDVEKKFDEITQLNWWNRLVNWSVYKNVLNDLKSDYSSMTRELTLINSKIEIMGSEVVKLENELKLKNNDLKNETSALNELKVEKKTLQNKYDDLLDKNNKLESDLASNNTADSKDKERLKELEVDKRTLESEKKSLNDEIKKLESKIGSLEKQLENKSENYDKKHDKLESNIDNYNKKVDELNQKEQEKIKEYFNNLNSAWQSHEDSMIDRMLNIAEKKGYKRNNSYFIRDDFSNNVAKGFKPDFVVKIGKQYVIFDAKKLDLVSKVDDIKDPEKRKLELFKLAAEKAKSNGKLLSKYLNVENVNPLMYEIVPSEVLSYLQDTMINLDKDFGEVQIISVEHVPTIIELLERIESYDELADMDPKFRDKAAWVIGSQKNVLNKMSTDGIKNIKEYFQINQKAGELLDDDFKNKILSNMKTSKTDKKILEELAEVTGKAVENNLLEVKMPIDEKEE